MKCFAAGIVFVVSGSLFAQTPLIQTASVTLHGKPGSVSNSKGTQRPDLGELLTNLDQINASTRSHVSSLQIEKWKAGWHSAWLKSGSQKKEAKELAVSLESNLTKAMPGLIYEAQDSKGSMSASFKLYNDLSAVVECVGTLAEMAGSNGRKSDASALHDDYNVLGQIRQDLASYIQLTADSLEPVDRTPRQGSPSYGAVLSAATKKPQRTSGR
jgi:hypothetical protein